MCLIKNKILQGDDRNEAASIQSISTELEHIPDKICEGIPEEHVEIFLKTSEKMLENIEKSVLVYSVHF